MIQGMIWSCKLNASPIACEPEANLKIKSSLKDHLERALFKSIHICEIFSDAAN